MVTRRPAFATTVAVAFAALVGLSLRAPLGALQPVVPEAAADLDVAGTGLGLLTGIIVLALGAAAPLAHALSRRVGLERSTIVALVVIAGGSALHLIPASLPLFLVAAATTGIGMGLGTALVPALIVKHTVRYRGLALGIYSTAMGGGLLIAVATSRPLAAALGGWPAVLVLWGAVAAGTAVLGLAAVHVLRRAPSPALATPALPQASAIPWRSRTAWLVTGYNTVGMVVGFAVTGWIVPYFEFIGLGAGRGASALIWLQLCATVAMLAAPTIADALTDLRPSLAVSLLALVFGVVTLLAAPAELGILAASATGAGIGGTSTLALLLIARTSRDHRDATGMNAMMIFVSYPIAASSPVLVGLVLDASGSMVLALGLCAIPASAFLLLVPRFPRGTPER